MIHGAGSSLWLLNNLSWRDHGKDIEALGDSVMAVAASEDGMETEIEAASGDSDQEVATEITDFKTKARRGVLIKRLVSNLK